MYICLYLHTYVSMYILAYLRMVSLRWNVTLTRHSFAKLSKLITLFSTIECARVYKIYKSRALS